MQTPLEAGQILCDRYEILKVLGNGSFGVVYGALDNIEGSVGRRVAIKQEPMQSIGGFEWQADIRAELHHPAIPTIYDYFALDEHAYLVMDWIPGRNLEHFMEEFPDPLSEMRVAGWAVSLCSMLAYLHAHPIYPTIFRDMKPNNVVVDPDDQIHAVDFGLARVYPPGYWQSYTWRSSITLPRGLAMGTEGYSPPEQYRGVVLPQSDIYALGASLHYLLTRRDPRKAPPFTFDQAPVRRLRPDISPEMESIVMKAVEYEVEKRYETAEEMQSALTRLVGRKNEIVGQ